MPRVARRRNTKTPFLLWNIKGSLPCQTIRIHVLIKCKINSFLVIRTLMWTQILLIINVHICFQQWTSSPENCINVLNVGERSLLKLHFFRLRSGDLDAGLATKEHPQKSTHNGDDEPTKTLLMEKGLSWIWIWDQKKDERGMLRAIKIECSISKKNLRYGVKWTTWKT